jgi:hypothetical protein
LVTIIVAGDQVNKRTPQSQADLERLEPYLHGELIDSLSNIESWELYCLADGFGRRTPEELALINDGWDWSHIRDSSPEALAAIRARLDAILSRRH